MKTTLDNGLTVILEENHAAQVVAFQAWVGVGSADEPESVRGIAHVFEHMLFKGTERRGVGQIAQEVEAAGGDINAWTSYDQTVYHIVMASRDFDVGLDILADALFSSSFDPGELERELRVVLEEIKQGEDSPARVVSQAIFTAAYAQHPYRHPVIGYERTVRKLSRPNLLDFFGRWYVPNNVVLVIVGDFDVAIALEKIRRAFGDARPRPLERLSHAEPDQRSPRLAVLTRDVKEAQLAVAFHIPGLHHADTSALDVLSVLLGQGDSSRLSLEVRRKRELATDLYAYAYTPRDRGLFVVGATTSRRQLAACTKEVVAQVFRLAAEEPDAKEVAKARSILLSDTIYQKETVQGLARKLGYFELVAGDYRYEEEYCRLVEQVTPQRVREVAQRYLQMANSTCALLVPEPRPRKQKQVPAAWRPRVTAALRSAAQRTRSSQAIVRSRKRTSDLMLHRFPSGFKLVVREDHSVPVIAMRAVWLGGLRYENTKSSGIHNLLASLLVRGTKKRSAQEISHQVETMAGSIGGFSGRNSFGLRGECLAEHWESAFDIFADCLLHPAFASEEIERERREVLEELRTQEDSLSGLVFRLFEETLFRRHPYRMDMLGTRKTVSRLTHKQLVDCYASTFRPSGMTLAVVGDVDPERLIAEMGARFDGSPRGRAPRPRLPVEHPPKVPREVRRNLQKQQAHFVLGSLGTTLAHKDRFPLEVLSTLLSGQGGRLFVELRDKKGLAYRISAFSVEGIDPGYFAVYMACSPENLDVSIAGVREELRKIRQHRIDRAELERAQRYLIGTHEISLQRRSSLASTMAFHECYGQGYRTHLEYAPSIAAVTQGDVQRVAQRYLDPQHQILAVVGPDKN